MILRGEGRFAAQAARQARQGPPAAVLAFRGDYLSEGHVERSKRLEERLLRVLLYRLQTAQPSPSIHELAESLVLMRRGAATISEARQIVVRLARRYDRVKILPPVEPWEVPCLRHRVRALDGSLFIG